MQAQLLQAPQLFSNFKCLPSFKGFEHWRLSGYEMVSFRRCSKPAIQAEAACTSLVLRLQTTCEGIGEHEDTC
jgi:hypothetical protein